MNKQFYLILKISYFIEIKKDDVVVSAVIFFNTDCNIRKIVV